MIRTNLSTRPFYNERIVHAVAAVVAALVLAVTVWQIVRVVRLSRYKTELNTAIQRDRAQVDTLTREAADIRRGLDQKQLTLVATQAKEANTLIEMRTFSWTQLFNQLEATLPNVHPDFTENGVTRVNMEIQGKDEEVIDSFWQQLEKTGAFHDIEWSGVNVSETGMHRVQMTAVYTGSSR